MKHRNLAFAVMLAVLMALPAWEGIRMAATYGTASPQGTSQAEDMFAAQRIYTTARICPGR